MAGNPHAGRDVGNPRDPVPAAGPPKGSAPKGLRAFDGGDAELFLALVPGPRGRDGLPESVRSWKSADRRRRSGTRTVQRRPALRAVGGRQIVVRQGRAAAEAAADHDGDPHRRDPDGTESRLLAALRRHGVPR